MGGKYWDYDEDKASGGDHKDDDGNPCNCEDQECGEDGACPECGNDWDSGKLSIVCGDHGCRCECGATFCCP